MVVSQSTLRREGVTRFKGASSKEGKRARVATNVYLRKTLEKPKAGLQTLRIRGSGVFFMHGEGISAPRVRHKGRQPLIKCAKSWLLIYFYFPIFYVFLSFGVNKSGAFTPTYPQLWWGTQTYVVLWESEKIIRGVDFRLLNGLF